MGARVVRWLYLGPGLGLLPLLLAYGIRWYYTEHAPAPADVLRGEALLVAVTWSATAIFETLGAPRGSPGARSRDVVALATFVLVVGAVAYGCRTADSATGRVQSRAPSDMFAVVTGTVLTLAACIGVAAVALAAPVPKEENDP